MATERHVVVFWDESVVPAAHCSGFDAARFVCRAAATIGAVKSLKYYVDVKAERKGAFPALRSQLKNAGVTVVDTASCGREGSAGKMLLTDTLIYAIDNPAPSSLLLVSADPDICYGISLLRMRGYQVYLLCPPDSGPDFEEFQVPVDFDASDFLEGAPRPLFGGDDDSLERQRSRSASAPRSSDSSKPPRGPPAHGGQTNGLQGHAVDAPSLLPSSEIDAFRQRFNSSRPNLDRAATNPFRPHRHSFSSFGRNGPSEPQGLQGAPSLRELGRHLNVDPKGKGRATDSDSMMVDSPIILTATSMSVSRSNSFGSVYRGQQASTAPTSAMPWYRPDFKMDGDGTIKKGGEGVYEGLVESTVRGVSREEGEGSVDGDSEDEGAPIRVARSVSGTTDGSVTPTAGPDVSRPTQCASSSSEVNELPQRIQVRASPPAATAPAPSALPPAAANAANSSSSMWTSRWTPSAQREGTGSSAAASTIPDTDALRGPHHAASESSVAGRPSAASATQTSVPSTVNLPAAQPTAETPSALPLVTRPESRMSVLRAAGSREGSATPTASAVQLQPSVVVAPLLSSVSAAPQESPRSSTSSKLPIASSSSQAPASASSSSSSSSSSASARDTKAQDFPGVPSHFNILIEVLREHSQKGAHSVDRNRLSSQLLSRQRNVCVAAGTSKFSKPFVRYYNAAFQAGIITSATGNVALTRQYRQST